MATKAKKQTLSAQELLSNLTAGKSAAPKKKDGERPRFDLTAELQEVLAVFVAADTLSKAVSQCVSRTKSVLDESCFTLWTESLWNSKNRPANPVLVKEKANGEQDVEGMFQVQESFCLNQVEFPDGKDANVAVSDSLAQVLVEAGMSVRDASLAATNIVANEVSLSLKPIIDLEKLVNGKWVGEGSSSYFVEASASQQAMAAKLLTLIQENFTEEDIKEILEFKPQLNVKKGFFSRICGYVKSLPQLRAVLSVVSPRHFPQSKKFGISDNLAERNNRLLETARSIIGMD